MIYIGTKEITEVPKIQPSNPVPILRKVNIIASTSVRATMTGIYFTHSMVNLCDNILFTNSSITFVCLLLS